ncbi:MAG: histidine kinase, partial [Chloroflexota bacterium]|nr:histidine kinase [Chloroflexota bacterium]
AQLELETERLERERAEQAHAVAEERARIARELHDIVAHSVSATVLQAEAADEVLTHSPDRARQSLDKIKHTGREALGELRLLLGIMRNENEGQRIAPQPRVADLERLVEEAQAEDLAVTLTIEGERRELPPGIDLSAYRIVQEALTNVRKHAGRPANASVVVRYAETTLELEIVDDGQGPRAQDGHGQGLIGMHERVLLFGGDLHAGPGAVGGFVVRARFPLPPVTP